MAAITDEQENNASSTANLTTVNLNEQSEQKIDDNDLKEKVKKRLKETVINLVEDDDIKEHYVYTISGVDDKRYLSNHSASNWIHQKNEKPADNLSLFEFIPCTEYGTGFWNIRNTQNHRWLSYGERKGELYMVGLYTFKRTASSWQIIPFPQKNPTGYILKCFFNGKCRGYLGYEPNEKWNKLHTEWSKACIYRFNLTEYGDHFIQNGATYAIVCYGKYVSYNSFTGYCAQKKEYKKEDCSFKFIRGPNEDTWYIQNAYADKKYGHWLSYSRTFIKQWALYSEESNRAIWRLLPCPKSMEFKFQCIYNNEVIGWSNTPIEHDENVRLQPHCSSTIFKLVAKAKPNDSNQCR